MIKVFVLSSQDSEDLSRQVNNLYASHRVLKIDYLYIPDIRDPYIAYVTLDFEVRNE